MISTLLLDLDGPLLEGKLRHYQCYTDILSRHGYQPIAIEDYWQMKRSRKNRHELLRLSGADAIYDTFLLEWLRDIESYQYLALDQVQNGVIQHLKAWHLAGIRIILVTMRNNDKQLMRQLEALKLRSFLDVVIVCQHANGGVGKALSVLEREPNIDTSHCLWIGDTEADYEGAKYLKCHLALLTCGLRTHTYLSTLSPNTIYKNLASIDVKNWTRNAYS